MEIRRLTYLAEFMHWHMEPVISPDGSLLAFSTWDDLYVGRLDERTFTKLGTGGPRYAPSFSPDGTKIACADASRYHPDDNQSDIVVLDVQTGAEARLTDTGEEHVPVFTPDGETVLFVSANDGANNISAVRRDTLRIAQLTHAKSKHPNRPTNRDPALTPDGLWIYYRSSAHSRRWDGSPEIYRMRSDGADQQRLTFTGGATGRFLISPGGSRVAFTTYAGERVPGRPAMDIWIMNADGTDHRLLDEGTSVTFMESFSPDGQWLAISSPRDRVPVGRGNLAWRIFLISTTSGEVRRLTEDLASDQHPVFTPDGERIVFWSDRDGKGDLYLLSDFSYVASAQRCGRAPTCSLSPGGRGLG